MEPESSQPKPELDAAAPAPVHPLGSAGLRRRALLRAGAGATPVLLTLGSGPVSATMPCTVASSFVSARTFASRNAQASMMTCTSNMNAGTWNSSAKSSCFGNPSSSWPTWAKQTLTAHLPCSGTSTYDSETLGWIMKGRTYFGTDCATTGSLAVLQLILGLTLTMQESAGNIQTAVSNGDPVTKSYLANVWSQYKLAQKFVVAGSVDWAETDIIKWLKLLQYNVPVSSMFT